MEDEVASGTVMPRLLYKSQSKNIIITRSTITFIYTGNGRNHV
jgi:hypothetical protein